MGRPSIHDRTPDCNPTSWACRDDLKTERRFDSQATCAIDVLWFYIFYIFSMDVCTTRHRQTSGRLVQEFNVCTVAYKHQTSSTLYSKFTRRLSQFFLIPVNTIMHLLYRLHYFSNFSYCDTFSTDLSYIYYLVILSLPINQCINANLAVYTSKNLF